MILFTKYFSFLYCFNDYIYFRNELINCFKLTHSRRLVGLPFNEAP